MTQAQENPIAVECMQGKHEDERGRGREKWTHRRPLAPNNAGLEVETEEEGAERRSEGAHGNESGGSASVAIAMAAAEGGGGCRQ